MTISFTLFSCVFINKNADDSNNIIWIVLIFHVPSHTQKYIWSVTLAWLTMIYYTTLRIHYRKLKKKLIMNIQCIHSNIWVIRWLISWIKTLAKVTNKSHCFCYLSKMLEYLCVDSSKSLIIVYAHFLHDSSHFPSYFNVCLLLNQFRPLPCFAKLSGDIGLYVEVHVMDKCWDKNFFFLYILHKARDL